MSVRLALETSTPVGSVAVGRADADDAAQVEVNLSIQETHSEVLLPAVDFCLAIAGVARPEIEEIVVGTGPGSFTGVRVAAAVAKGWSFASDVSLYGFPTLLALAAGAAGTAGEKRAICALLDARRSEVYAAGYRFSSEALEEWLEPGVFDLRALGERMRALETTPLCVGPGAHAYRAELEAEGWPVASGPVRWPRAASLLWLRAHRPDAGARLDPNGWEPLYVRDSGARARRETAG